MLTYADDNSQVLVNIANSVDEWFWVKGLSPLEVLSSLALLVQKYKY